MKTKTMKVKKSKPGGNYLKEGASLVLVPGGGGTFELGSGAAKIDLKMEGPDGKFFFGSTERYDVCGFLTSEESAEGLFKVYNAAGEPEEDTEAFTASGPHP